MTGAAAGGIGIGSTFPLEVALTRYTAEVGTGAGQEITGVFNAMGKILATDGFYGFTRGSGVSLCGIMTYCGLYFGLFDTGKALFNFGP